MSGLKGYGDIMAKAMIIFEDVELEGSEDEIKIDIENVISGTPTPAQKAASAFYKMVRKIALAD